MRDPARLRAALALGAIVALAAVLRLHGVAAQPLLGDEAHAAASALHYVRSGQFGPTMWYHPNLRNLVTWAVGEAFGHGPGAQRATSVVLGLLSVPLAAALLLLLTRDRLAALGAAFLLAVDQVHITFSRQAIQETWTTFFILLGTTLAVLARSRRAPALLALAGVAFGLGISSKFHAVFPLAVCGAAGLALARRERSAATAAWVVACLAALPALVFLLTYAPWFARGYGLGEWLEMQRVLLAKMASHGGNAMDQAIDVEAWQWFLRPMGYASFVLSAGAPAITVAYSNPTVWLAVLPATAWIAAGALRGEGRAAAAGERAVLLLFAASYLPLALGSRPIWLVSSVAVVPFATMIVALAAARLVRERPRAAWLVAGWAGVVLATSLALYPMATGRAADHGYLSPIVARFRPPAEAGGRALSP